MEMIAIDLEDDRLDNCIAHGVSNSLHDFYFESSTLLRVELRQQTVKNETGGED